jgi:hypothetical protein
MGFWREFKKESQRADLANKNIERLDLLSKKLFPDLIEFELGNNPYSNEMNFSQGIYSIVIQSRVALQDANTYHLYQYSAVFALIHLRATAVGQEDLFKNKQVYAMRFTEYGCFELSELFQDLKYINYGYSDKILSKEDWEMSHQVVKEFISIVRKEIARQSVNNKLTVPTQNKSTIEFETSEYLKFLENSELR